MESVHIYKLTFYTYTYIYVYICIYMYIDMCVYIYTVCINRFFLGIWIEEAKMEMRLEEKDGGAY
jgi:hypothetical protein